MSVRLAVLITLLSPGFALAGDLTPPAGPLAPSMKTLQQVEPRIPIDASNTPGDADSTFRISQPGNYFLTADLLGESGKHGIEIDTANVTIDLMGFELLGGPGTLDGINAENFLSGLTVRNGRITKWGDEGVDLQYCNEIVIEDLVVTYCGGSGVLVYLNSAVRRCTVGNCLVGVFVDGNGVVTDCNAFGNTGAGFETGWGSYFSGCVSRENGGHGYSVGNGVSVSDCASMLNVGSGFYVGEGSSIGRCTSYQDNEYGVRAGAGTTVENCTVRFAHPAGIWLEDYGVARNNTVSQTINDGIVAANSCTVAGNSVLEAGVGGGNFGHGIRVTGTDTRVESNQATDCDLGYKVTGTGNLIARNTSSGNAAHWDIAANNRLAVIVLGAVNAAPVVGTTYGGNLGTTDPFANIVY